MSSSNDTAQALRSVALVTIRRSWQHLGISVALSAAILGWYVSQDTPTSAFVVVALISFFLVVFNVARVAQARKALREPARLVHFAAAQRRSHLVRGHIYVAAAPVLVGVTWIGALSSAHRPTGSWAVLLAITFVLVAGWVQWRRVLRHLQCA